MLKRFSFALFFIITFTILFLIPSIPAETTTVEFEVKIGGEFYLDVGPYIPEEKYKIQKSDDWFGYLSNNTIYGDPEREGTYWFNITSYNDTTNIKIIVVNSTGFIGHNGNSSSTDQDSSISYTTLLIIAGVVIVGTTIVFSLTDYGLWNMMGLFNKLTPKRILKNENRMRIYEYIQEHPWTNYTEIHRGLNIPYRTLRHHLKKLIEYDFVVKRVDGAYIRFKAEP